MNLEQLKTAVVSETGKNAATLLSKRERKRSFLSLNKFKTDMIKQGLKLVPEEFNDFFKKLESAGVGSVKKDRFIWYYSMKDVGDAILHPERTKELEAVEKRVIKTGKRRGRPKGSKGRKSASVVITLKTSDGRSIPIDVNELTKLIEKAS